jgi:DNA polymerase/3'-5' exonuclease PolX
MKFYELLALFDNVIKKLKNTGETAKNTGETAKNTGETAKNNNSDSSSLKYIINAYNNVIKKINAEYNDILYVTDKRINDLDITTHMKQKLIELSKTTISPSLAKEIAENRPKNKLRRELSVLIGLGNKKIQELLDAGLTSIKQLHQKKWFVMLNVDVQVMIKYKPVRSITYQEATSLDHILTNFDKSVCLLTGSYRREKPVIRDFDILFLSKTSTSVNNYISYLAKVFSNRIWVYSQGDDKISFVFQPNAKKDITYKADIFIATPENYYSMLLYTTGSKFHNIKMRARAKQLNLLLNQNGIFSTIGRKRKINKPSDNEKKLFEILNMPYVEPKMRF